MKQTEDQKLYSQNVDQHLNRIIAMKQNTLETLPIYNSTVTYASVVKGKKTTNEDEDNVSNMTDQTAEKNREDRNLEKKTKD